MIGKRELLLSNGKKVIIIIDSPVRSTDYEDEYQCLYHIFGLQKEEKGYVIGCDALQALQLTFTRVGAILYTSKEWKDNTLSWNGDKNLGFPTIDALL
jgi:hypothetical protein